MSLAAISLKNRNPSMDVIRGVAVLGILLMNIPGFSIHSFFLFWVDVLEHKLTVNGFIVKSSGILFDGKMRGLFTLLFGAGLMLFIANKKNNSIQVADAYFRRMMWLLLFGIIDGYILLWGGDVLYEYALCGMFLFAFRNLRVRYMIAIAVFCIGIYTYGNGKRFTDAKENSVSYTQTSQLIKEGKVLTAEQKKTRDEFQHLLDQHYPFSKKEIQEMVKEVKENYIVHHSGYAEIFEKHSEEVFQYQSQGFYTGFWESFGTILIGMALFKMGFFEYRLKLKSYRLLCFAGIPIGIILMCIALKLQAKTQADLWDMYSWRPFSTVYLESPARLLIAIGYASALMLLCKVNWLRSFLSLFANVGRMAFTNYIMQTVLCSLYFFGFGLGHYGEYSAKGLLLFVICIWLLQITYCWIYFKYFSIGPLEWLWKRLTYGKGFNKVEVLGTEI